MCSHVQHELQIVKELGGEMAASVQECTHLVTDKVCHVSGEIFFFCGKTFLELDWSDALGLIKACA
jgi:hypothetical protein